MIANQREENENYPLTTIKIAKAQKKDQEIKIHYKQNAKTLNVKNTKKGYALQLFEDTKVLCKDDKFIIPVSLWQRAVSWYHHYLQYPGHSCLEETMRSMMHLKGILNTIWSYVKSCKSCQISKRHSQKYGHVPPKLVITTPWRAFCVDLIGQYTLKSKYRTSIDFICLTMIDPATTWFKIVELPTVTKLTIPNMGKGKMVTCCDYTKEADTTFDKSSAQITNLVYKTWFIQYPFCQYLMYNNGSKFKLHLWTLCNTYGI